MAMGKILGVFVTALVAWVLAETAAMAAEGRWQQVENKANCAVWNEDALKQRENIMVTWSGPCENGKAQGHGTLVVRSLEDGEWERIFEGDYKDGRPHGRGVVVFANGGRYEGDFKDGKPHGRGVLEVASGRRYEGDFRAGLMHGRGVVVFANGLRYEGDFKDNEPHGSGVIVFANGDKCDGIWRKGKLLGTGKAWNNSQKRWGKCYWDGNAFKSTY